MMAIGSWRPLVTVGTGGLLAIGAFFYQLTSLTIGPRAAVEIHVPWSIRPADADSGQPGLEPAADRGPVGSLQKVVASAPPVAPNAPAEAASSEPPAVPASSEPPAVLPIPPLEPESTPAPLPVIQTPPVLVIPSVVPSDSTQAPAGTPSPVQPTPEDESEND